MVADIYSLARIARSIIASHLFTALYPFETACRGWDGNLYAIGSARLILVKANRSRRSHTLCRRLDL